MNGVLIKRRKLDADIHTGRMPYRLELCCHKLRNYQKLERGQRQFLPQQREHDPTGTLILES